MSAPRSNMKKFFLGDLDIVRGEVIFSREDLKFADAINIVSVENEERYETFYMAKPKEKGNGSMGGKQPYMMLMQNNLDMFEKVSVMGRGILFTLVIANCVAWGDGKIINRKNKKPLTSKDISLLTGVGLTKTRHELSAMVKAKILMYNRSSKAYYVDRDVLKKGGKVK